MVIPSGQLPFLVGKSTINGPFSMAIFNTIFVYQWKYMEVS